MKKYVIFTLFLLSAFAVSAKDVPCQVNLQQGQFNKAIQKPGDKNLNQLIGRQNLTLPEVMAKADRFKIVQPKPVEQVVLQHQNEEEQADSNSVASKLGGMFQLLVPAKLRNPAR